jgi:hypothetical protein
MNLQGEAKIADFGISAFVANTVANVRWSGGRAGRIGTVAMQYALLPQALLTLFIWPHVTVPLLPFSLTSLAMPPLPMQCNTFTGTVRLRLAV